jgi:hypothetical protein
MRPTARQRSGLATDDTSAPRPKSVDIGHPPGVGKPPEEGRRNYKRSNLHQDNGRKRNQSVMEVRLRECDVVIVSDGFFMELGDLTVALLRRREFGALRQAIVAAQLDRQIRAIRNARMPCRLGSADLAPETTPEFRIRFRKQVNHLIERHAPLSREFLLRFNSPRAFGTVGHDFRLYILRLQTPLAGVAAAKVDGLPPLRTAQARLHGIPDQFFRADFLLRCRFLNLLQKRARKSYGFRRHRYILLLRKKTSTRLTIPTPI